MDQLVIKYLYINILENNLKNVLRYANTPLKRKFGEVKLMIETGETTKIKVPIAIMKDVVQPFYEEKVIIQTYKKEGKLYLKEISLPP
ncbi:MAG: hypothetical protein GY749_27585 [Desulfobacteraceae bacterium]|nr:hypothetical protein [Desulfobacteraceae bacterium]